jgi:hypothetical protein
MRSVSRDNNLQEANAIDSILDMGVGPANQWQRTKYEKCMLQQMVKDMSTAETPHF